MCALESLSTWNCGHADDCEFLGAQDSGRKFSWTHPYSEVSEEHLADMSEGSRAGDEPDIFFPAVLDQLFVFFGRKLVKKAFEIERRA